MNRVLAFALMLSVGNASVAVAGETLLDSATRVAQKLAPAQLSPSPAARQAGQTVPRIGGVAPGRQNVHFQQGQRGIESSGLRTRSKVLIGLGVAAGFVGIALAIDSRVEDNTPSTKGERQKNPF